MFAMQSAGVGWNSQIVVDHIYVKNAKDYSALKMNKFEVIEG